MTDLNELLLQREELDQKIQQARRAERNAVVSQVKTLVADYGLTARECGFSASGAAAKKPRGTVAAKYRGPNGETWTGRGRAPIWMTSLEAKGRRREEFLIG